MGVDAALRAILTFGSRNGIETAVWKPEASTPLAVLHPDQTLHTTRISPPLFVNRQFKTLWFLEEDILANTKRSYFPGSMP